MHADPTRPEPSRNRPRSRAPVEQICAGSLYPYTAHGAELGAHSFERIGAREGYPIVNDVNRDVLRPVSVFVPDWTRRRIAESCRAGRIPGAKKVGREWMM